MILKSIVLNDFRNFEKKKIEFSEGITIIVGDNTVGKTNILEGIYLLATGKSFKARLESEMITYGDQISRISCRINADINLEVILTNGEVNLHGGGVQKAQRKKLLVNGVSKRLLDFAGNLKVVLFGPWDMDLVTASPSLRRRFLDSVLSQTDREYRRSAMIYEKGIRQRNRLLLRIRDENLSRGQLMYWDRLLIKHGQYITKKRGEFIEFCNTQKNLNSKLKTPSYVETLAGRQNSKFKLKSAKQKNRFWTSQNDKHGNYSLIYDKSVISEGRLKQYENEEVAAGMTLVGPHRDDFVFRVEERESRRVEEKQKNLKTEKLKNEKIEKTDNEDKNLATYGSRGEPRTDRNLAVFGSRGEQRMGVLWLKLAELSYIETITKEKPLLLLDDIFSELDHEHREIVMRACKNQQTIITTADPHNIESLTGIKRINLVR